MITEDSQAVLAPVWIRVKEHKSIQRTSAQTSSLAIVKIYQKGKHRMRLVSVLLVSFFLYGCASSPITPVEGPQQERVNFPPLGETTTRGLGETLVAKGARTTGRAVEVIEAAQFNKAEGEASIMTCALNAFAGIAFKRGIYNRGGEQAECYGPFSVQATLSDGTTNWNCPGRTGAGDICVKSDGTVFLVLGIAKFPLEQDFDHIRVVEERTVDRHDNFVQEFVYNGKSGDSLKFVYREFAENMLRPAYTQDVQYDLSESNTIGFRNLRMEIVEATNTEIVYKLISSF